MKTLKQFITEAVDVYRLSEVTASYFVQPEEIIIQAPETYNESDIQIYLDDKWLKGLPGSQDYAEKLFGINHKSIIDTHFEYDTFEHISIEPKDYIEWESKYDETIKEDTKLEYFKLTNIKYIIEFNNFDLVNVEEEDVQDTLNDIFKAAESNNEHDSYSIEIMYNETGLKYRK